MNSMTNKRCDLVVIGGGGSGLVAAVKAAEAGPKVIVLEKTAHLGGGMLFASTMRTFQSNWQKERNIPDQSNAFLRRMMDLTMWKLDAKLVKNAILGTGRFFDWYAQYELPEVLDQYQARPYVFDIAVNGQPGPQIDGFHKGSGQHIMETMLRRGGELGVEFLTEAPARDLIVTNGKITSVLADTSEGQLSIACRAVVLACGSWICNREVVEQVLPAFNRAEVLPSAHQNPAYTGDGIPLAQKAGAFVDWDSFCLRLMGPICSMGDRSKFDTLTHLPQVILVDLTGKRFAAEPMAPRMDPFDTGHVILNHPKGRAFFLLSANALEEAIAQTRGNGAGDDHDPFGTPALPPLEEIDDWFTQELAKGTRNLGRADTIEELALQIGLDPAALSATLTDYNASCASGCDWSYYKDPANLTPLTRPPFYAIGAQLATDGAFGGVRVDPKMQAYRPDGSVVDGLYVTGDFASGRHIVMDGVKRQVLNDMSWALASGFLAGEAVGEALNG